jgi:hypothetical protein
MNRTLIFVTKLTVCLDVAWLEFVIWKVEMVLKYKDIGEDNVLINTILT